MDARTFDRDDAGLLEARDRRIDFSGSAAQCTVHALSLTAADTPHNLQNHQILCALHWSEGRLLSLGVVDEPS
jgi:hypothetical protein